MGGAKSTQSAELDQPWRSLPWGYDGTKQLENDLSNFKLCNKAAKYVRILLVGEVGAGKSSFINSVNNAFQHRMTSDALVDNTSGTSFTKTYKTYYIEVQGKQLPFVFNDIMGLEPLEGQGANPQDVIKALKGLMEEGHKFNPSSPLTEDSTKYRENPDLQQQTFCLVNIIAADKLSLMDQRVIDKLRLIRQAASELEIPQVIILTKIEDACPLVKESLRNVYKSRKIKEKMQACSHYIGVPMNHIFPVKNYNELTVTKPDTDLLILTALKQIVQLADDRLRIKTANRFE